MYTPILKQDEKEKEVHICAWCDDTGALTRTYKNFDYFTTLGVCKGHTEDFVNDFKKSYGTQDVISNDSNARPTDGLPIVRGNEPR